MFCINIVEWDLHICNLIYQNPDVHGLVNVWGVDVCGNMGTLQCDWSKRWDDPLADVLETAVPLESVLSCSLGPSLDCLRPTILWHRCIGAIQGPPCGIEASRSMTEISSFLKFGACKWQRCGFPRYKLVVIVYCLLKTIVRVFNWLERLGVPATVASRSF